MGICICCGTETKNGFKICIACDNTARHSPCKGCTADTGRAPGCADTCDRHKTWTRCRMAIKKLEKERAHMYRTLPTDRRKR